MASRFWEQVRQDGHPVPDDRPLAELTTELTAMLGDPDEHVREELAFATLAAWIAAGVYDELLQGLGDGMAAGLTIGLGEDGTDTVFRRTSSVRALTRCIHRDNEAQLVPPSTILDWGDRIAGWFVRESDLRGPVPGKGWAYAVAHGADALGAIAACPTILGPELTVLLDVLADRLLVPTEHRLVHGEHDRLSAATLQILRRDLVPLDVVEPWTARLAAQLGRDGAATPEAVAHNVQSYLRSLHLHLALAPQPPACRADLLLVVIEHLRRTTPSLGGDQDRRGV